MTTTRLLYLKYFPLNEIMFKPMPGQLRTAQHNSAQLTTAQHSILNAIT